MNGARPRWAGSTARGCTTSSCVNWRSATGLLLPRMRNGSPASGCVGGHQLQELPARERGTVMGDIGKDPKEYEFEPLKEPHVVPADPDGHPSVEPADPVRVPAAPEPATAP